MKTVVAKLDGTATTATSVDLKTLTLGSHSFSVTATDFYGNVKTASVTFTIDATVASLNRCQPVLRSGDITKAASEDSLLAKLDAAQGYHQRRQRGAWRQHSSTPSSTW